MPTTLSPEEKRALEEALKSDPRKFLGIKTKRAASNEDLKSYFTFSQAAEYLDLSEKTISRRVEAGEIEAQYILRRGRKQGVIDPFILGRYKLILEEMRQWSRVPLLDQREGFRRRHLFLPPGEQYNGQQLPHADLSISLIDFWRFCKSGSVEEKEFIRQEVRYLIPGAPERFEVSFRFDPAEVTSTLERVINSVLPELNFNTEDEKKDFKADVLIYLLDKTLPYLDRVKDGPIAYLCQSVRNFFSDWILQQVNQLSAVGDLADLEKLELMRLRKRMGRKPNLTPKY